MLKPKQSLVFKSTSLIKKAKVHIQSGRVTHDFIPARIYVPSLKYIHRERDTSEPI